ncbi:hypothetical protein ACFWD7_10300 [Streptomyces mirabilis]|nr:hypothetical protein [Streptomyces mirabilis]MCT9106374.1 hypothetical protein [Streptomyces mirabilis]
MRLGKALATGVAQERTRADEDNLQLPEELPEKVEELEASVPEEVPVAR